MLMLFDTKSTYQITANVENSTKYHRSLSRSKKGEIKVVISTVKFQRLTVSGLLTGEFYSLSVSDFCCARLSNRFRRLKFSRKRLVNLLQS